MRRKNRAFLIALVSCLSFSSSLWAVGLGQLRADSSINQPLSVRIQLVDLGSTPLDEISVAVADVENFDRLDVEFADNFPAIQISLGVDEEGPYARLESASVIRTPYLEVVLDTRWPSGRVLTQHTILLDPPVFLDSEDAVVADSMQMWRPVLVLSKKLPSRRSLHLAASPPIEPARSTASRWRQDRIGPSRSNRRCSRYSD